ncbi:MAG: ribose 5-phosphate isomerase B [Bacteroides sp.]|nr:ribose 5-phosphate isomerase B [Bacteroides sp.]MCM1412938.1 ribose 5-phosphate isomerase B [Bacteroides sp.]MCM1471619.1 ribose 5-phosphate isomerase B [Bacteroides sp.]
MSTKIALCSDHAGFELKKVIIAHLEEAGYETKDFGTYSSESCDYPDYAHPCALAVESGEYDLGIAMCGTGNGIAMTLNKHQGIRAALCWDVELASLARRHNDANVLVLPARFIAESKALEVVDTFLHTDFEGGRHARRIAKIPVAGDHC